MERKSAAYGAPWKGQISGSGLKWAITSLDQSKDQLNAVSGVKPNPFVTVSVNFAWQLRLHQIINNIPKNAHWLKFSPLLVFNLSIEVWPYFEKIPEFVNDVSSMLVSCDVDIDAGRVASGDHRMACDDPLRYPRASIKHWKCTKVLLRLINAMFRF